MKASDAKKTLQKQYNRQNDFIKNNYDRIALTAPIGTKERIKAAAPGESVNGFINRLISQELERLEQPQDQD